MAKLANPAAVSGDNDTANPEKPEDRVAALEAAFKARRGQVPARAELEPASAAFEMARLDQLVEEEFIEGAEYTVCISAVYEAMGPEFGERLEDAVLDRVGREQWAALDRLVIGMVDEEGVTVHQIRTTRRTRFAPTFAMKPTSEDQRGLATHQAETKENQS